MSKIKEILEDAELRPCDYCGDIEHLENMIAVSVDTGLDTYEFEYMCTSCADEYERACDRKEKENGNDS